MNNARRKVINNIYDAIGKIGSGLEELQGMIEDVKDEEEEAMDNMPESLQESERYSCMEEAVSNLEDAYGGMQEAIENLETVQACLEDAGV